VKPRNKRLGEVLTGGLLLFVLVAGVLAIVNGCVKPIATTPAPPAQPSNPNAPPPSAGTTQIVWLDDIAFSDGAGSTFVWNDFTGPDSTEACYYGSFDPAAMNGNNSYLWGSNYSSQGVYNQAAMDPGEDRSGTNGAPFNGAPNYTAVPGYALAVTQLIDGKTGASWTNCPILVDGNGGTQATTMKCDNTASPITQCPTCSTPCTVCGSPYQTQLSIGAEYNGDPGGCWDPGGSGYAMGIPNYGGAVSLSAWFTGAGSSAWPPPPSTGTLTFMIKISRPVTFEVSVTSGSYPTSTTGKYGTPFAIAAGQENTWIKETLSLAAGNWDAAYSTLDWNKISGVNIAFPNLP